MTIKLSGSIVAIVTPMHADGSIDWENLSSLVDWHIQSGTDGIVTVGTTGESPTLSTLEHQQVIAKVIELVAGRIPVIAGTGSNSTAEAKELTVQACTDGADACLSVVPYYNKPTQDGLLRHFNAIADVATKPLVLYNVPARTITDLANDTVIKLSAHPQICGLKDATGNIARLKDLRARLEGDFIWLSGDDVTAREYVIAGGHGVISITANIAPRMMHDMIAAATTGDAALASEIDQQLAAFNNLQSVEANPIPIKWALAQAKRINAGIRLPLAELSPTYHKQIHTAVEHLL